MSDKFDKFNRMKIQQKVADLLGMDTETIEEQKISDAHLAVPVPDLAEIILIDNPELPDISQELLRLEHGQRQQEILLERGETAVFNLMNDLDKTPPMYKGKTALATAELYKAVADLGKAKIKFQLEIAEIKMKMAAFVRRKIDNGPQQITGNTFVINREELIRQFGSQNSVINGKGDE